MLDFLKEKGVKVVATTHYSKLKEYALKSNDVLMASVQFDMEAMKPTFKYLEGIAGQSYAFEIAARFNLGGIVYKFGTMIETPRAALQADKMARVAEFFSFGTNDLTQTTLALSRDAVAMRPGDAEVARNPRARSAVLRIAERTGGSAEHAGGSGRETACSG